MEPNRIFPSKFPVFLIAVFVGFLMSPLSTPAAPANKGQALIDATVNGDAATVQALLDQGVNVDGPNNEGAIPLILASYDGHEEILEVLLKHGGHVNHQNKEGKTALSVAKTERIAKLLKAAGAK